MPFTEDFHRTNAVHAALEWMLLELLRASPDPKATLARFREHMAARRQEMQDASTRAAFEDKMDLFSNLIAGIGPMEELEEHLVGSVNIRD